MKRGFLNSSKVKKQPLYPGSSASQAAADAQSDATTSKEQEPAVIKLAYGKVENTAIPEDYKPSDYSVAEADSSRTDHAANTLLMTTIPSRTLDGRLDPDGHSEWIVLGPTKAKVLNAPGYPQPLPKPVGPPSYTIKSTPNMGMGVFATRDIKLGELIFAERPLLVTPRNIGLLGLAQPPGYDSNMYQTMMMYEWEKRLEVAVGRMTPEDRTAFKSLMNNHKEDGSGPLLGIIRTNGYGAEHLFDGEVRRADDATAYSAVVKLGSRINHSCMLNITHRFSLPSFSFQFTAKLDIKAGEQLFFSYCGVEQSAAERQAELAPYGIVCDCSACANATPETDKLRKEYKHRAQDYMQKIFQWISGSGPLVAESVLDPILQFRKALIKEGLHFSSEYKSIVLMIQQFYEKLGLHEKAKPYMEECARYKLDIMG